MLALPARSFRPNLVAAVLLLGGVMVFVPNLSGFFLADDFVLLGWTRVHTAREVWGFFDPYTFWYYRPFVKLFYWAGQGLSGLHAWPLHLFSMGLHWANGYLVYRLVARLGGSWAAGLGAGLLFLANGHHAETVSWIAAVGDLAGAFCLLAGLLFFTRFSESGRLKYVAASVGLFAFGLLWRETVVLLPVLALLYLAVFGVKANRNRGGDRSRQGSLTLQAMRYVGLFVGYGIVLVGYLAAQAVGRGGLSGVEVQARLQFHALNLDSILLGILDYVHGLVPGGSLLAQQSLDTLRVLVWVEWVAIVLVGVGLWRVRERIMLFGLAWMLATPLVFIFFSPPTDRYFYLPSIGYAILAGAFVGKLAGWAARWRPQALRVAKVTAGLLGAGLLLGQAAGLITKENRWVTAGQTTGGVFHDVKEAVPDPHNYSAFYFVGLPAMMDGVPVFQNSLPQGVQLVYDNRTIAATTATCEDLRKLAELPRYSLFFGYKGDGVEQFGRQEDCR